LIASTAQAAALSYAAKLEADGTEDELRSTLAVVLTNALKSFTAAFSLLRGGWRLQPFQCIRNGYEAMSVALHLFNRPEELAPPKKRSAKININGQVPQQACADAWASLG
jgi:hypothetical protein